MRLIAWVLTVPMLVALVVLLPDRNPDADVPPQLAAYVEPARQDALTHLDLLEPGTRLRFIGARCREDGAALLSFTNRWWWLFPRTIEIRADPVAGLGGGGYVGDDRPNYEAEVFFTEGREVDCETGPARDG
jgi:hypothetical protein